MRKLLSLLALLTASLAAPLAAQTTTNPAVIGLGANCDLHGFLAGDATSPWNHVATGDPIDAHNAQFHSDLGNFHLFMAFAGAHYGPNGISYNCVDQTVTPFVPVRFESYAGDSDITLYPFYPSMMIEDGTHDCPFDPDQGDGNDHHGIAVTRDGWAYETWVQSICGGLYVAENGSVWDLLQTPYTGRPYNMTSADAAGLPMFPYLLKYDEVATPLCDTPLNGTTVKTFCHQTRMTFQGICGAGYANGDRVPAYKAPATHGAPTGASTGCYMFEGSRLRLRADFPTSGYTGAQLVMIHTWQTYGFSVNDTGRNFAVAGTADARWDTDANLVLQNIAGTDIDLLATGPPLYDGTSNGTTPQASQPAGLQAAPTGSAPVIAGTPALSRTTLTEGQSVTLRPAAASNATYQFIVNGLPFRGSAPVAVTPRVSTCYSQTARNAFGSTTVPAGCVTVLPIPFKGVTGVLGPQ